MQNTRSTLWISFALTCFSPMALADLTIGDQRGDARSVMESAGVLVDLPYKVTWREFPNAAPLLEALNANHLDAGSIGDAPLTFASSAGAQIKAIKAFKYFGNAVLVKADSPVHNVKDLIGKRVATVKGSSGHAMALSVLEASGVATDQVEFVFTTPAESTLALTNGDVDAVATWEPYASFAILKSEARVIADGQDFPALSYFAASPKALETKADELSDFARRLADARLWGAKHATEYSAVVARNLRLPENVAASKVKREGVLPLGDYDAVLKQQQKTIDLYARVGLIPTAIDAASLFDEQLKKTSDGRGL